MTQRAATLFVDPRSGVSLHVDASLREVLAPEVYDNIRQVVPEYNLLNDSVDLLFERQRDRMKVLFRIPRYRLLSGDVAYGSSAMLAEETQLAKLILFLA
jgi:hypothetical protein